MSNESISSLNNNPIRTLFSPLSTFLHFYRFFERYVGHRMLVLAALSFITTLTEGLGIAIFFAYLQKVSLGTSAGGAQKALDYLAQGLAIFHIEATPIAVIFTLLATFFLRGALVLCGNSLHFRFYADLAKKVTFHLVDSIAHMSYREYVKRNSGYFTHLVTKGISDTVTVYYQVSALIPKAISVLTYVALSLRMNWRFTLLAVAYGFVISNIFRFVTKIIRNHSRNLAETESGLTALMIQMIQSFKYLFATGSTENVQRKIQRSVKEAAHFNARIGLLAAIIPATSEPLIVAFIASCVFYQTQVTQGALASLFIVVLFLYRVMREATVMQGSWQTLISYSGNADRVIEVLRELNHTREANGQVPVTKIADDIHLHNVSFAYAEKEVLKNVTLHIPAHSMVALVGESGAGKSTVADILCATLTPTKGNVKLGSNDLRKLDHLAYRSRIGYVTQEGVLFDDTIGNNISLWQHTQDPTSEAKIWDALKRANCADFVLALPNGIHEPIGDRGVKLSGGQRQRLCLAREFYKNIDLLILDEATSALDSESEQLVQASIDSLKGKATIVLIAHRLSTVRHCDYVCVLKKGEVAEFGAYAELMKSDSIFRRMHAPQDAVE